MHHFDFEILKVCVIECVFFLFRRAVKTVCPLTELQHKI